MMKHCFVFGSIIVSLLNSTHLAAEEINHQELRSLFSPLPKVAESSLNPLNENKIQLGNMLFNDKNFSLNRDISCNSCHDLNTFGVDNKATSTGHNSQKGDRSSPTVYNAALHFSQFWDGRAANVEEQALGPVLNPIEMAMKNETMVVNRINENKNYPSMFKKAFPNEQNPVTFKNFGKAIGAFERTLLTPSRFDEYLKGNDQALTSQEIKGLTIFKNSGCGTCHNGVTLGGQMYQKIGMIKPFASSDIGRMKVTKNEADKYYFKVPSLRNITKTAPYFHDGSVKTLNEAIKLMGEYQLGKNLTNEEINSIAIFLQSLTGTPKA